MTIRIAFHRLCLLLVTGLALLGGQALAGQFEQFGEYQVHYSIFPSSFLTPAIADQYKIVRSQSIGIVNVSILKQAENGRLEPVSGQVQGDVVNDIQQRRSLGFRRISEGKAVYYIAEFPFSEGELLTFELEANVPGAPDTMPLRVAQTLLND